ncbi:MAG: cellulase family glycosylhydrolase [Candidatus Marinimicrobia bacterium]|nr:cellulase family glycosylhydrolase [Candidatus Neomarinimicrobiota bacterium]
MKNILKSTIILFLTNFAFGFFAISGQDILDNAGKKILLRGLGLGGWLVPEGYMLHLQTGTPAGSPTQIRNRIVTLVGEEKARQFYAEYIKNYVTKEDIQLIADWGYNHIRLPFSYKFLDPETASPIFVDNGYEIIDQCLEWCKDAGIYMILDMHCAPGGQNPDNISDSDGIARLWEDSGYQDQLVKIWTEIAARYADEEWIIGYDLINEPVLSVANAGPILRQLYVRIRNEIRKVDNNHLLFIEGNWYATDFSGLDPVFDVKMVYSFHKYWSENDNASIQEVKTLRQNTGAPLWLGETGENSNHWFAEMVQLMETNNIGWCNWTHKKFDATTCHFSADLPENWSLVQSGNPSETQAFAILMQMAENLKTENCRVNPGVTPAYLNGSFLNVPRPLSSHTLPGRIFATDYDLGANGSAYFDEDYYKPYWDGDFPWNKGYKYRNDGVDIEECEDAESNGYNVGWTSSQEWLNYTVSVTESGTYNLRLRFASSGGGQVRFLQNGFDFTGTIPLPDTYGWQKWQTISVNNIWISAGQSDLRMEILQGSINISKMEFELVAVSAEDEVTEDSLVAYNYPNPFNSETQIPVKIAGRQFVKLQIYDIAGRLVCTLVEDYIQGNYRFSWKGNDLLGHKVSDGIYFYRIQIGTTTLNRKMIFLK